jgi:hypothetical protein
MTEDEIKQQIKDWTLEEEERETWIAENNILSKIIAIGWNEVKALPKELALYQFYLKYRHYKDGCHPANKVRPLLVELFSQLDRFHDKKWFEYKRKNNLNEMQAEGIKCDLREWMIAKDIEQFKTLTKEFIEAFDKEWETTHE